MAQLKRSIKGQSTLKCTGKLGGRGRERERIVLTDKETSDKNNHIRGTKEASELFLGAFSRHRKGKGKGLSLKSEEKITGHSKHLSNNSQLLLG